MISFCFESNMSLRRWSHSAVSVNEKVIVFGGFGVDVNALRNTPDQRLATLSVFQGWCCSTFGETLVVCKAQHMVCYVALKY
jgi:hypothetical protein